MSVTMKSIERLEAAFQAVAGSDYAAGLHDQIERLRGVIRDIKGEWQGDATYQQAMEFPLPCEPVWIRYTSTGRIGLGLRMDVYGVAMPTMPVSTNIPLEPLDPGEMVLQYGLSSTQVEALVRNGLIRPPHRAVHPSGASVAFLVCRPVVPQEVTCEG